MTAESAEFAASIRPAFCSRRRFFSAFIASKRRLQSAAGRPATVSSRNLSCFRFVTESDRLFVLRCLHTRSEAELAELESSDEADGAPTASGALSAGVPQPPPSSSDTPFERRAAASPPRPNELRCSYVVVHEANGAPIKSVRIGAPVRHEWRCDGSRENQCLLVTNCFIKTIDSQHELIDEYGCSKDRNLIAALEYTSNVSVDRTKNRLFDRLFLDSRSATRAHFWCRRKTFCFLSSLQSIDSSESLCCKS